MKVGELVSSYEKQRTMRKRRINKTSGRGDVLWSSLSRVAAFGAACFYDESLHDECQESCPLPDRSPQGSRPHTLLVQLVAAFCSICVVHCTELLYTIHGAGI